MTSPYSTGGGGTHFEAKAVAYYLTAALAETPARAVPGLHVTKVLTQRGAFGEPLDDIIVNGISEEGHPTKLSLQVKSSLSFTEKDSEWIDVLGKAWNTFNSALFNPARDLIGVAISSYHTRADKYYQSVLSWAAHSPNGHDFSLRIMQRDFSHKAQRDFVMSTRNILVNHAKTSVDDDTLWRFLSVFRIIHFDFDNEDASRDELGALERISHCLILVHRNQTQAIWTHLIALAGDIIPTAGGAERTTLTSSLQKAGLPSGVGTTFWRDIQAINRESKLALDSIKCDIHGLRLNRLQAHEMLQNALQNARFIQIDGEPGCGKSAFLKQLVEEIAQSGPVILLRDNRIQPRGWSAHANLLGISSDLIGLMSELGTISEPILFIDGIDKVNDPATQLTVNDLIHAIATEPTLSHWKIVVTVREQNLEHISTWIDPTALKRLPMCSVTIPSLGIEELNVITDKFPRLKQLLLEPGNTDIILRRPFFLEAVLSLSRQADMTALPATEVELLQLWWRLGGADRATQTNVQHRRNSLLKLAERLALSPHSSISINELSPDPLEELRSAGVIIDKQIGHSVIFSHDIYEEWALCEWLIGKLPNIVDPLKECNESQILIRPVQLLGTYELETNSTEGEWLSIYEHLVDTSLRPVWHRAILTSCLHSTRTTEILSRIAKYLHQNNDDSLKKLLNALQTLEVVPNPTVLNQTNFPDLEPEERASLAFATALPKLLIWLRFLDWYLRDTIEPSPSIIPNLLPVFTTWQNACAGQNIIHSQIIGEIAYGWLSEFEAALHPENSQHIRQPFGINFDHINKSDLEENIRSLFLSSAGDVPSLVSTYLDAKVKERQGHFYRKKILKSSGIIARFIPKKFVDFFISAFLHHTKDRIGNNNYSSLEKELGVKDDSCFYPSSPDQSPFLLLLRFHEFEGLILVKAICNHSVDVWRWLHQHPDYHVKVLTPLPIEIDFPWGRQVFWGDGQVYLWFRGYNGNYTSQSALMALELWAFERIEAGDDFAEVCRKVIEGNDSVAALGLALSLCLAHLDRSIEQAINQALPLITCPHIWMWEVARVSHDLRPSPLNEIANWQQYRHLLNAVRDLNRKPHRRRSIRDLVPYFVFWQEASLKEQYTIGIRSFTEKLPLEYAEENEDKTHKAALHESMRWYVEQADPQFWHKAPTEDGKQIKLWNEPPSANSPERLKILERHALMNRYLRLALWAQNCLERDNLEDSLSFAEAFAEAKELDRENLFAYSSRDYDKVNQCGAVAGTAYVIARYANIDFWNKETASWTFNTLMRAASSGEFDELTYRGSILSMHPIIFAVHGLSAFIARGSEVDLCQTALLNLALSPLDSVKEAVAKSAKLYAKTQTKFYWALFVLFVRQCIINESELPSYHSLHVDEAEASRNYVLREEAQASIIMGNDQILPEIPLPWLECKDQNMTSEPDKNGFKKNPICFQWHIAEKTILNANHDVLKKEQCHRLQFVILVEQLVSMTIQLILPPFVKSRHDYQGNIPFEWFFSFFRWLGNISSSLSSAEVEKVILQPLFNTDNETALLAIQNFAPSYLAHTLLPPAIFNSDAFSIWEKLADWIIENPEGKFRGTHIDREYSLCIYSLLFCFGGIAHPQICGIDEGWKPIIYFKEIIENVVRKFGTNTDIYLGILRLLKKGGMDFMPEPGLSWLHEVATTNKNEQDFWLASGQETVEILKLVMEKKSRYLSVIHRGTIAIITDILIDNGVRGAGFLQQEQRLMST